MADISIAVQDQIRWDLEILMRYARYQSTSTSAFLEFSSKYVAPFINSVIDTHGVPVWKSFMTDDFSPVEYSWAWKPQPHVRFSFDPVGPHLDRGLDPFNRMASTECIERMRNSTESVDWTLLDILDEALPQHETEDGIEHVDRRSDQSLVMLAAESKPGGTEPVIKAYLSTERAEAAGLDPLVCIDDAFRSLDNRHTLNSALTFLMRYSQKREISSPIKIILAGVDCVDMRDARTKVYFRTVETSFESVLFVLSMDGQLQSWSSSLMSRLKELWYAVLNLDADFLESQSLPQSDHETSGMLYYASLTSAKPTPSMKVYIPVKHYGVNDWEVASGLVDWMKGNGHASYSSDFLGMLEQLCKHRRLDESRGMQTYISVGVKAGELDVTSYVSQEFYHPG